MELNQFQQRIADNLSQIALRFDEPMSKHTSFRIGGPAAVMAFPQNEEELSEVLKVSGKLDIKPVILGAGTNVLAPDEGLPGLIVCLKDCMNGMELLEGGTYLIAGPKGATGVEKLSTFSMGFVLILFTLFIVLNLINSKEGRAIKPLNENRIAAESVGINVTAFRMKAFVQTHPLQIFKSTRLCLP